MTGDVPCGRGVDFRTRDQFAQAAVDHVFRIVEVQVVVSKLNPLLPYCNYSFRIIKNSFKKRRDQEKIAMSATSMSR